MMEKIESMHIHGFEDALDSIGGGEKPVFLFLHPIGLDGNWWHSYRSYFQRFGKVITPDLPGHGQSSDIEYGITLAKLAEHLASKIEVLSRPVHVIGVSFGGMLAQHLALSHPKIVASIALISTLSFIPEELRPIIADRGEVAIREGMDEAALSTAGRWAPYPLETLQFHNQCFEQLVRNSPSNWRACWKAISEVNTLDRLHEIECPTLVICAEGDTSTTLKHAQEIAGMIKQSTLHSFPESGHMAAFSHSDEIQQILCRFYTQQLGIY